VGLFAVSAVGRDRPGIVAAIADGLFELDGNVEDSRMTILRGHFAVMLIVSVPDEVDVSELERRLGEVRERLDLEALTVNALDELDAGAAEATHVITVYGADHPGIVSVVSSALAERGVNITDLQTKLTGAGAAPMYVMMLEVALADDAAAELERSLEEVADDASVEVHLHPLETEAI
jgi:glycine cleavage system transcriptional repressor